MYVLTNKEGWYLVNPFSFVQNNCFSYDHKIVSVSLSLNISTQASMLFKRALDMNYNVACPTIKVHGFKGLYDYGMIIIWYDGMKIIWSQITRGLLSPLTSWSDKMMWMVHDAHKEPECRVKPVKLDNLWSLRKVNDSFKEYKNVVGDSASSDLQRENALNRYLHERSWVHYEVLKKESDAWSMRRTQKHYGIWLIRKEITPGI